MPWTPTRYGLPSPGPHDEVEPLRQPVKPGEPMAFEVPKATMVPINGERRAAVCLFGSGAWQA